MATKRPKVRSASEGDSAMNIARSGSDPVGETIPVEESPNARINQLLADMVEAKLALDQLAPAVEAANKKYDGLREQLDAELVEAGLQSAGALCHGHRIAATLASRELVKVTDRAMVVEYVKKKYPGMLTVNTQTLSAWLRSEAPSAIKEHPEKIGCSIEKVPQLQIRITAVKA